ncbi:MAG: transglutaminase domain-containing protein [Candidatus Rokubacteria bacterium]|nr:transglutaminase domain-containing protein [Candidatus Rokubacteria bacterium]
MTPDERAYYATQSRISDPGDRAALFATMPSDPARLITAVTGLVLHETFVKALGITPDPASGDDIESRTITRIMDRILARDGAPLDVARPPERRFIGVCRDYTMVACAALRHHGVPARARVGFADYFAPGFQEDHWVCEYHDGARWRLLDPELGPRVREHFRITFPPDDVPRERFLTGGGAWQRVRQGTPDPATCGLSSQGMRGDWFVAGNVVRDLAALNKREMLPWDVWGVMREWGPGGRISEAVAARLDDVAAVIARSEPEWKVVRELYDADEALRVPSRVIGKGAWVPVDGLLGATRGRRRAAFCPRRPPLARRPATPTA